eukprot:gb/GEZN01009617.1/.p1 GENE.gb/GEZN01009617.1/~~gb/GEZN01009617.1/.p1  ORF type:complete len:429 (+),score=61.39 gb/GEZN01009617.1/:125-1288(+)
MARNFRSVGGSGGSLDGNAEAISEPFTFQKGMREVVARPGPPGGLQIGLSELKGWPFCLFSYGSLRQFDENEHDRPSSAEDGWVYGAKLTQALGGQGVWGMLAHPTGQPEDVVKGRLLCWPAESFRTKLRAADKARGYDPNKPNEGFLRRGLVSVARPNHSSQKAHWYYQELARVSNSLLGAPLELHWGNGMYGQVARTLLIAAQVNFNETKYTLELGQDRHQTFEPGPGKLDANLGRPPVLRLADGSTLGQARAIERFLAKQLGLMGKTELEEAQVDSYCEHLREFQDVWRQARGNVSHVWDPVAKKQWYERDMPLWMQKLERVTGSGGHAIGNSLSLADVMLYIILTQTFDYTAEAFAAYAECHKLKAVLQTAQKWLVVRSSRAN